jgi:hypothetical protein
LASAGTGGGGPEKEKIREETLAIGWTDEEKKEKRTILSTYKHIK